MKNDEPIREGYWKSAKHPDYPEPLSSPMWKGKFAFIGKLQVIQSERRPVLYRGIMICKLCEQAIGMGYYTLTFNDTTFKWPTSYTHYLTHHNVRPSEAFLQFVNAYIKATCGE